MAEKNSKPIAPKNIEVETEEPSSILDDIYDVAYDIFPEPQKAFRRK